MARRRGNEKPGLIVEWDGRRLAPISAVDDEDLRKFPVGSQFRIEVVSRMTDKLRRLYWSVLGDVVKATDIRKNKEALHEALKWDLDRVTTTSDLIGRPRLITESMADWHDAEMREYFDHAMARLAELIGYDPLAQYESEAA